MKGLAEESGKAYKDINEVVGVLHNYGITKKVVGLIPVGNVKGNVSMNSIVSNLFLISLFVLLMNVVV